MFVKIWKRAAAGRQVGIRTFALPLVSLGWLVNAHAALTPSFAPPEDVPCVYGLSIADMKSARGLFEQSQRLDAVVRVSVDAQGSISSAVLSKSSGNATFDALALKASRRATCRPFAGANGQPAPVATNFRFTVANADSARPQHAQTDTVSANPPVSAPPAMPASQPSPLSGLPFVLPPVNADSAIARFGIEPGSTKAAIIRKWAEQVANDSDIKSYLTPATSPANPAAAALTRVTQLLDGIARLPRDDRMRLADLGLTALDHAPADCGGLKNVATITSRYLPVAKMSDDDFKAYLQVIFDLLKQSAQTTPVQPLTPEERLQGQLAVSSSMATALKNDPSAISDVAALIAHRPDQSAQSWCRAVRVSQRALQATPQPYRDWAMLASNEDTKQAFTRVITLASLAASRAAASPPATANLSYAEKVQRRIRPNIVWSGPIDHREAVVAVHCLSNGILLSVVLVRTSGDPDWDAAALRAVRNSGPMPVDFNGKAPTDFQIALRP